MSFKAKLYIEGQERNLLNSVLVYSQIADYNGRPTQLPVSEPLQLAFESTKDDELFYNYMFHPDRMFKGYIRFFKRDGFQKDFDIEFANAHIINLYEHFSSTGDDPMYMHIIISYGISRVKGTIHEKKWNPSNPFEEVEETATQEEETSILDLYYENSEGEQISKLRKNKTVFLVINTNGMVGKSIDLDLSDSDFNFEYNGELLENDQLLGLEVTADTMKVELITKKQN
ncbi:type VI secretion system tube protein TssD [Algibacter sp. TI.3.09]|uniref:type VI secretion system tube protein TssD n=1 Tax=Algibacter sp. TI.3.09 TaxID=3121298 RepID=UPI00311ED1A2